MQSVRLYINDVLVEFDQQPDINYNYKQTDFESPLDLKNGYSKTVVVPGTKNNNILFDNIWRVDRTQQFAEVFNPSKRVPFTLFVDSTLYESGYVKLDTITRNEDGFWEYNITLFSGIGEFIYNLTYNQKGDKLKLSDIWLGAGAASQRDTELDFTIDKDEVTGAWIDLGNNDDQTWDQQRHHVLNYAPCYEGKPKNFSTNKVVLNMNTTPFSGRTTQDGQTFGTIGGYALGELVDDLDEWGIRDLRSWIQRPVLRMKNIIQACTYPTNNCGAEGDLSQGYTVNLDPDFFNSDNPYYEDTWLTLPTLDTINYESSSGVSGTMSFTGSTTGGTINLQNKPWITYWNSDIDTSGKTINSAEISFKLQLTLDSTTGTVLSQGIQYIKTCFNDTYGQQMICPLKSYKGAFFVQLVGYNSYGRAVAGSDVLFLTSVLGFKRGGIEGRTEIPIYPAYTAFTYTPEYQGTGIGYKEYHMDFVKGTGANFVSDQNYILKIKSSDVKFESVKLVIHKACGYADWYPVGQTYVPANTNRFMVWQDAYTKVPYWAVVNSISPIMTDNLYDVEGNPCSATFTSGSYKGMGSYAKITKQALLNTKYTPADYLLSYCKMFGLYLIKRTDTRTIDILTRKNFYKRQVVDNIEDIIDFGKEWTITPLTFDSKFYDFAPSVVEGEFAKDYSASTNVKYGMQRIDTGYDFDANNNVITDKLCFKSAVEGIEKSPYYSTTTNGNAVRSKHLWMVNGFKYTLYGTGETTAQVTAQTEDIKLKAINPDAQRMYYDFTPKVQFRNGDSAVNGENVLLFFNGYKNTNEHNPKFSYYVTDDLIFMNNYNGGNACWLYTASELDSNGERIAYEVTQLPVFERYRTSEGSDDIRLSLDFGTPRQLYVPGYTEKGDDTIYAQFWKDYFEDMYDIDNKILTCWIRIKEIPNPEMFRKFYWFQNSLWRLNSITNWVPGKLEPTQVEFLKVKDINNYTTNRLADENTVSLTLSKNIIGYTGGTVQAYVTAGEGVEWVISCDMQSGPEGYEPSISISPTSGTGNGIVTIDLGSNESGEATDIVYSVKVYGPYNTAYKYITQPSEYAIYWQPNMDGAIISYSDEVVTVDFEMANCEIVGATASTADYILVKPTYVTVGFTEQTTDNFIDHKITVDIKDLNGNHETWDMWVCQATEYWDIPATGSTTAQTSHVKFTTTGSWWVNIQETGNTHTYTFEANTTTSTRQGNLALHYNGRTVGMDIYQAAGTGRYFIYNPTSLEYPHAGNTQNIMISANTNWVASAPDWITLSQSGGTGSATVAASASSRTLRDDRTGNIVFTTLDGTYTIPVKQYGNKGRNLSVTASTTTIPSSGATVVYRLLYEDRGDDTVSITCSDTGATIGNISWVGEVGEVTITYSPSSAGRSVTTTFDPGSAVAPDVTITTTQTMGEYLTVSTHNIDFDSAGGTQTFTIDASGTWEIVLEQYDVDD